MKRLWDRSTTALAGDELRPEQLAAVREHAELVGAADPLPHVTMACVTRSQSLERRKLFRRPPEAGDVTMLLAPPRLVVLVEHASRTIVSLYRLDEIELAPFRSSLAKDSGLNLTGMAVGATERAVRFLPLDEGPDGAAFRAALLQACGSGR